MAISNFNSDISDYFDRVLDFLKEYQWIYNYPNTDVLVQDVFEKMPKLWLPYLKKLNWDDLKDFALCEIKDGCPESLKEFFSTIHELRIQHTQIQPSNIDYDLGKNCGLSIKKQHEIISLAPVIAETCDIIGSNEIIDVGAGLVGLFSIAEENAKLQGVIEKVVREPEVCAVLHMIQGYLSFLLAEKHNCSVLAIEGCADKMELALKSQKRNRLSFKQNVRFLHHFITATSLDEIKTASREQFQHSQKICICGLHACADLSITILELFLKMKEAKSLVIMPCCYHRLNLEGASGTRECFSSFPISNSLKSKFAKYDASYFLRRPFLRLACQQTLISFTSMSDEDHQNHAENFFLRAILQKGAHEVDCNVTRLKRKTGLPKNEMKTFEHYIGNLCKTHALVRKTSTENSVKIDDPEFKQKLLEIWGNHKDNLLLMEVLTALQASIQSICEHILLQDRVQFLRENGVNCYIRKVTDDGISPRCYALVAIKDQNKCD